MSVIKLQLWYAARAKKKQQFFNQRILKTSEADFYEFSSSWFLFSTETQKAQMEMFGMRFEVEDVIWCNYVWLLNFLYGYLNFSLVLTQSTWSCLKRSFNFLLIFEFSFNIFRQISVSQFSHWMEINFSISLSIESFYLYFNFLSQFNSVDDLLIMFPSNKYNNKH